MPKLLCTQCDHELRCICNEVVVMEFSDHGPYKLWFADEYGCSQCPATIVTGWGDSPFWQPHRGEIPTALIEKAYEKGELRYDFENEDQRNRFLDMEPADRHFRQPTVSVSV